MDTAAQVVDYVVRGGMAVFLLLVIVGGSRQWWVFGNTFLAMKAERDDWRKQAEELMAIMVKHELDDASRRGGN